MRPARKRTIRNLSVLFGILLIYSAIQFQLPHKTFWSNDAGEKLLQVRALVENGPFDPAIPYDPLGMESSGRFRFAPFPRIHMTVQDGRLIPAVPFYFPLLSSVPYRVLGEAGLYVFPIVFSIVALALLGMMTREYPLLVLVAAGLASPIFFYSLTFWEHTMAMCMVTSGFFLVHLSWSSRSFWNPRLFAAGAIMVVGAWVRSEIYIVIIAALVGFAVTRRSRLHVPSFILGVGVGLVPFLLLNQYVYGNLFGPQVTINVPAATKGGAPLEGLLRVNGDVIRYLFLTYVADIRLSLVCFFAAVVPVLYFGFVERWSRVQQRLVLLWSFAIVLSIAFTFAHFFTLHQPMNATLDMLGLWASLSILPFAFVQPRSKPRSAEDEFFFFLFIVTVTCLVGFALGLPSVGGLQWGPRYALALFPILVLLSVRGYAHLTRQMGTRVLKRSFQLSFLALVLLGICIQGFGIRLLAQKKEASAENNRRVESIAPGAIVTDVWWFAEESADLYERIPMYQHPNAVQAARLADVILDAGQQNVLLVSRRDLRGVVEKHPRLELGRIDRTRHKGIRMFEIQLLEVRRAPGQSRQP